MWNEKKMTRSSLFKRIGRQYSKPGSAAPYNMSTDWCIAEKGDIDDTLPPTRVYMEPAEIVKR